MSRSPYTADAKRLLGQLSRAGLSEAGAAQFLGVGPRTMRRYIAGERRIPAMLTYALCWLEVRDRVAGFVMERSADE